MSVLSHCDIKQSWPVKPECVVVLCTCNTLPNKWNYDDVIEVLYSQHTGHIIVIQRVEHAFPNLLIILLVLINK